MRTRRTNRRSSRCERTRWAWVLLVLLAAPTALAGAHGVGHPGGGTATPAVAAAVAPAAPRAASWINGEQYPDLAVAIALPNGSVDPWAVVTLSAIAQGGFPGIYRYLWTDTLGQPSSARNLTLRLPHSGTVGVGVEVRDSWNETAWANATLGIGRDPSIALASSGASTDAGLPLPLSAAVSGGTPPYQVAWQSLPNGSFTSWTIDSPGIVQGSIVPETPGFLWVRAAVTDAYRITSSVEAIVATVHPMPTLRVSPAPRLLEVGDLARVTGLVTGGTPPFAWTAIASLPAGNISGASGQVGPTAPLAWSGRFLAPGNATVDVAVVDAAGVPVASNTTIVVLPELDASLLVATTDPECGAPLNVSAYVAGGAPPYSYSIRLSDGERASGTLAGTGVVGWVAHPESAGYLMVQLSVGDALSASVVAEETVPVVPSPTSVTAPPTTVPSVPTTTPGPAASGSEASGTTTLAISGGVGLALLGGLVLWSRWRGRRAKRPAAPGGVPKDAETVRRILEESGRNARVTLRLLAEEEGVDEDGFDAAVSYWRARGRARVEEDPDGGESIHWTPPGPAPAPTPPEKEGG